MKKLLLPLLVLILITLTLTNAVSSLNRAGDSTFDTYRSSCDAKTVFIVRSRFLNLPTEVSVEGRNCSGPNSAYSKYTAQIWDHLFWIL